LSERESIFDLPANAVVAPVSCSGPPHALHFDVGEVAVKLWDF